MEITESLARRRATGDREKTADPPAILARWLAFGFGIGHLPLAPGTWGALFAVLFLAVLYSFPAEVARPIHFILALILIPAGGYAASATSRSAGNSDPRQVVIDEIAGQLLCFLMYPPSTASLMIGFLLFRFFDITKPFPIRQSERLGSGIGIMLDDLVAGLYAGLVLWGGFLLLG